MGIHDTAAEFRLKIEGQLTAAAAREAEACWRTAASTLSGRRFALDITEVISVDESAKDSLMRLRQAGAEFAAGTAGLEDRTGERGPGRIVREIRAFLECLVWRLRTYCCPGLAL